MPSECLLFPRFVWVSEVLLHGNQLLVYLFISRAFEQWWKNEIGRILPEWSLVNDKNKKTNEIKQSKICISSVIEIELLFYAHKKVKAIKGGLKRTIHWFFSEIVCGKEIVAESSD